MLGVACFAGRCLAQPFFEPVLHVGAGQSEFWIACDQFVQLRREFVDGIVEHDVFVDIEAFNDFHDGLMSRAVFCGACKPWCQGAEELAQFIGLALGSPSAVDDEEYIVVAIEHIGQDRCPSEQVALRGVLFEWCAWGVVCRVVGNFFGWVHYAVEINEDSSCCHFGGVIIL